MTASYPLSLIDFCLHESTEHCQKSGEELSCVECTIGCGYHCLACAGQVAAIFAGTCLAVSDTVGCPIHYASQCELGLLDACGAPHSERIQAAADRLPDLSTCLDSCSLPFRYLFSLITSQVCCVPCCWDFRTKASSWVGLASRSRNS